MKLKIPDWRRFVRMGLTVMVACALAGCEDGGDNGGDAGFNTPQAGGPSDSDALANASAADPMFPDGLHPNSEGDQIIARTYARFISPTPNPDDETDRGTVVCLGDSITHGGYPRPLAGLTGMNVIDAGRDGESSSGGDSRAGAVLDEYNPQYLCILYGANDVNGANLSGAVVAGHLKSIIDQARDRGVIPIVGTLTPMSGKWKENADDARAVSAAIRSMASATGTALADLERQF